MTTYSGWFTKIFTISNGQFFLSFSILLKPSANKHRGSRSRIQRICFSQYNHFFLYTCHFKHCLSCREHVISHARCSLCGSIRKYHANISYVASSVAKSCQRKGVKTHSKNHQLSSETYLHIH